MQQHDAARRQGRQRLQHGVKGHAQCLPVEIRVGMHRKARAFKNRHMVIPSRIGHPDCGLREIALEKIRAHFQRARTAQSLDRGDATLGQHGSIIAKQQATNHIAIRLVAFHRQVNTRHLAATGNTLIGLLNGVELRNHAFFVVIQADREIDLVRARIGLEGFHQRQDRVASVGINVLEHGQSSGTGKKREIIRPDSDWGDGSWR